MPVNYLRQVKQYKLFGNNEAATPQYVASDIIVLSLQPYAYEKVIGGGKRMEYRTRFRKRPSIALIYVSSPVKEIRGLLLLGQPVIDTPQKIGELAELHLTGNGQAVYDYLKHSRQAYAIPIERYIEIPPLPLQLLREKYGFIAPQSYAGLGFSKEFESYIVSLLREIAPEVKIADR